MRPLFLSARFQCSDASLATAPVDEHGFSPNIFSGLFGSYGVCVSRSFDFFVARTDVCVSLHTSVFCFLFFCSCSTLPLLALCSCSYNTFVSSSFLPLEEAARYAISMRSFETPPSLLLSFSGITHSGHRCRELVLLRNGNLVASCFVNGLCYVNGPSRTRKYYRLGFPQDSSKPEYRGPAVASSANSDLFRMLCHFSDQLLHMHCAPAPLSIEELDSNVSSPHLYFLVLFVSLLCVQVAQRCATRFLTLLQSDLNFGLTLHGTFPDSFSTGEQLALFHHDHKLTPR
jgi:hypothetical protein